MKNRTVTIIADEIRTALKHETADVFAIGALLAEAKTQVKHGGWLPWLHREFSMSPRTSYRYLAVHGLKLKFATVANLNLTANALYWLSDADLETKEFNALSRIATKSMVGATDARAIVASLRRPLPTYEPLDADPGDEPESAPEEPPALPPPPPTPLPLDAHLINEFTTAIQMLMKLWTKASGKFVNAVPTADLETMVNFLKGIAAAQTKLKMEK